MELVFPCIWTPLSDMHARIGIDPRRPAVEIRLQEVGWNGMSTSQVSSLARTRLLVCVRRQHTGNVQGCRGCRRESSTRPKPSVRIRHAD